MRRGELPAGTAPLAGCSARSANQPSSPRCVMPHERALHYILWHVEAYGCPAPPEEVVELLKNKYAMNDQEADELITGLVARGDIKFIKQQYLTDGFVPVEGA